ncbi:MAG: ATP-dependent DNA ligase, partial [Oscillochloridaceae bacterium]|nr:ATP-dependent DNA ligase [Oscillochloridaceae bacterium]
RRGRLAALLRPEGAPLAISPLVPFSSWAELEREFARSRELRVEGLMLKRRDAPYTGGRRRGAWWKWKLEPLSFDAVLVYAEPGHGRRAGLLTDYTFAVWDGDRLVPVAKAYSGLDEPSLEELDRWLRRNTLRRFGPVRAVAPRLVFEIGCEGVQPSTRHRAGLAVR